MKRYFYHLMWLYRCYVQNHPYELTPAQERALIIALSAMLVVCVGCLALLITGYVFYLFNVQL